jgi:hypothetical protein
MPLALCCMSHSPLLDITKQDVELELDVKAALSSAREFATEFDPDVVVVFAPDHFNGFFWTRASTWRSRFAWNSITPPRSHCASFSAPRSRPGR